MIIWIASYPKSGNTYLRSFISSYYFSKKGKFDFDLLLNILQFPSTKFTKKNLYSNLEASQNWIYNQNQFFGGEKINFVKTHNSLCEFKGNKFTTNDQTLGAIYIVRDPRNVITSLSNHNQLNFDQALEFMTNSKKYLINKKNINNFANFTFLSSWSEHYKSWKNNKQFKNFFLKYEDLEKNPIETFKEIILFINKILKKDNVIDMDKVKKIVESISFDKLKKEEQESGFPEAVTDKNKKKINFFYLGKKNKWDKILTNHQINLLNRKFKDDLINLKYKIQ